MLFRHTNNNIGSFIIKLVISTTILFGLCHSAHAHRLEQVDGLKRFNKTTLLVSPENPAVVLNSSMDIKNVKIGQNVLAKAIDLTEQGGEIHNITSGNRSDKVTFSFFQPLQESSVEQRIDLNFDKNMGFINAINLRYFISSAYLSIELIREQVLQAAVTKYGPPLTLQEAQTATGQTKNTVKIADFINTLPNLSAEARDYFKKLGVTRNAKISADPQGYGLFQNGFDQCYLWLKNDNTEILNFCAFAPGAANANSRGLEFSLVNFPIAKSIADQQVKAAEQLKLNL